MVEFVVGLVVGASAAVLLLIVFGGSRRIRAEKPLERDVETQILLGEDPDKTTTPSASPSKNHPRNYSADELAQLRRLGTSRRKNR
ncbi:MAG TPA: hypothetical protein VFX21_02040 [Acidimicrobiia bacterium]|nr:hypothetical protein [Acidimicrobiia bacterium]